MEEAAATDVPVRIATPEVSQRHPVEYAPEDAEQDDVRHDDGYDEGAGVLLLWHRTDVLQLEPRMVPH